MSRHTRAPVGPGKSSGWEAIAPYAAGERPCRFAKKPFCQNLFFWSTNQQFRGVVKDEMRNIAAAVTVAAVGVLCALAAVTLWLGSVDQRDALLQAAAADGAVSGRMVALGRELEREGAKVAGANLIKEARELAGGRTRTGRLAAKTHLLQQKQQGAYPAVPFPANAERGLNVGFSGGAPFKLGAKRRQAPACLLAAFSRALRVQRAGPR